MKNLITYEDIIEKVYNELKDVNPKKTSLPIQLGEKSRYLVEFKKNELNLSREDAPNNLTVFTLKAFDSILLTSSHFSDKPCDALGKLFYRIEEYQKNKEIAKEYLENLDMYEKIVRATRDDDDYDQEGLGY